MNTRLREIRLLHKMSQEEFGKKIGIESRAHISALESGSRNITDRIVKDICREFNINEKWLRYGEGEMLSISLDDYVKIAADIDKNDKKARQVIIDYWHLSEQDKKLFWNFMNRFIKKDEEV